MLCTKCMRSNKIVFVHKSLITSFNFVSAFTAVVEYRSLFESGRLTIGGGIVGANTLCTLFDELSFDVRYRLFLNVGAFNCSIGGCFSLDDVDFRFSIVRSLDLVGSRFEFSLDLGIGREGSKELSLDRTELLCGKFLQRILYRIVEVRLIAPI